MNNFHQKQIYVDLDDTLCYYENNIEKTDYSLAKPKFEKINLVNSYYNQGAIITIYTARGTKTGIDWRNITEKQLLEWGVKYHNLQFGKPAFDILIDDKVLNSLYHWSNENVQKILDI
jgi:CMP-N,N'-diacetyllegionaminic acid synthase